MPRSSKPHIDDRVDSIASPVAEEASQSLQIPSGHIGPIALRGSGRLVWWTGRVAIGLRHQERRDFGALSQSGQWIQALLLHRKPGGPLTA